MNLANKAGGGFQRLRTWYSGVVLVLGLLLLAVEPVAAGAPAVDCAHPFVFSGGTVNVVILPYKVTSYSNKPLSLTAKRLTLLMETDVLFSILKYGSVGAIRLVERPGQEAECQPDIVLAKLLGEKPGASERLRPGHGVVLIWGRIYEENEAIYLQSYMRFLRKGVPDDFTLSIKDRRFVARMPTEAVAFAPKHMTTSNVEAITRDFEERATVRRHPDPNSPGQLMPLDVTGNRFYSYYVVETRGDWMQIQGEGEGPSGWVRAGAEDDWPSTLKMGKLDLVEAVVGYLHYRASQDGTVTNVSKRAVEFAQRALARFENSGAQQVPMARALGETLRAYFGIFGPSPSVQDTEEALRHLREAVALVPFSAEARNLEIQTNLYLAYQSGGSGFQPSVLEKNYLRAASLEPDNPRLLANLENFYQLMVSTGPPPGSVPEPIFTNRPELEKRLVAVQAVREKKPFPWDNRLSPPGSSGSIVVAIRDATGAVIPGVRVTLTHAETGQVITGTSDASGRVVLNVAAGNYRVRAEGTGFAVTESSVTVTVGAAQTLNLELKSQGVTRTLSPGGPTRPQNTTQLGFDGDFHQGVPPLGFPFGLRRNRRVLVRC